MKKKLIGALLTLAMGIPAAASAFAQVSTDQNFRSFPLASEQADEESSDSEIQSRGRVISTGILQISNRENGNIGVYIQTLTHQEADETVFGVYLDRWIESQQRWATVANYRFIYNKEEHPDDDLTMKSISFDIAGQPADCYYRLRGAHLVVSGDSREMLSSETDGILITKDYQCSI